MRPDAAEDQEGAANFSDAPRPRSRRGWRSWAWLGAAGLLVVAVLLGVLPSWLARSGRWKTLLAWSMPELVALVDVQSLTVGWLTPLRCEGLLLRDPSGAPLVEAAAVRLDKSLAGLLWSYPDLGTITCAGAQLHLVLRRDGSNLEDFLAHLPAAQAGARPLKLAATLSDAALQIDDRVSGRRWEGRPLQIELTLPGAGQRGSVHWRIALREQPDSGTSPPQPLAATPPGQMTGQVVWLGDGRYQSLHVEASAALDNFPCAALTGVLRRLGSDVQVEGPVSLRTDMTWDVRRHAVGLVLERLEAPSLKLAAPAYLGRDVPTVSLSSGTAELEWLGTGWNLRRLELRSSLGELFAWGGWSAPENSSNVLAQLASFNGQIQARLDLAELLRQLPDTLHRRPETNLRRGEVELLLASSYGVGGRLWSGQLRCGPLVAVVGGRPVELAQPIELAASVRETSQGLIIERLDGQSQFLALQGQGNPALGQIQLRLSLDALSAQLQPLFDLGGTRLAGTLVGEVAWQPVEGGGWSARAAAQLEDWQLALNGKTEWTEKALAATAQVEGHLIDASPTRLTKLQLLLRSDTDSLEIQLTKPVEQVYAQTLFPLAWAIRGELGSWLARTGLLLPLAVRQASGSLAASGQGRIGLASGQIESATLEISDLFFHTDTLQIREPTVRAEVAGRWDVPSATLVLDTATLASSALALRAEKLHMTAGDVPVRSGTVDLRGDLARLSTWLAAGQQPPANELGGRLAGRLELALRNDAVAAGWSAEIEPFIWQRRPLSDDSLRGRTATASLRPVVLWHEPRVRLEGQGRWETVSGRLVVDKMELAGSSLLLRGGGTWDSGRPAPLQWTGELTCDWEAFTSQVQWVARQSASADGTLPLGLDTLQVRGRHAGPVSAHGPLRLPAVPEAVAASVEAGAAQPLTPAGSPSAVQGAAGPAGLGGLVALWSGQASVRWDEARYVGLVAGPAELAARLEAGVLAIGPLDVPLAEGRLRAAPQLMLATARPSVRLPGGKLLESVRISPEMCAQWLKFVAPLVAEATRAEGTLSVDLDGGELPLDEPWDGRLAGTLQVRAAQIGPGPLAQQYLAVARQLLALSGRQPGRQFEEQLSGRAWLVLPAQQVPFALHEGSVAHRGLTMQVGDLTIVTQGKVHIATQQLDLAASFPLPESWFSQVQGPLAALRGQTITLPISGTLSRPRVQMQGLEGLGKQLAAGVVEGLLRNALQPAVPGEKTDGTAPASPRGALLPELGRGLERLLGPKPGPTSPAPPPSRLPR